MSVDGTEKPDALPVIGEPSRRGPGGRQPGAGRKPTHGAAIMRKTLRVLTTKRLDGRSTLAVAVRRWKEDVRADLGRNLSRAQETLLEGAAQSWVILSSLDDWIARQPTLVQGRGKNRAVLHVVMQRQQLFEGQKAVAFWLRRYRVDPPSRTPGLQEAAQEIVDPRRPAAARDASPPVGVAHFRGQDVATILSRVAITRGLPQTISVDNGTKFTSRAFDHWADTNHSAARKWPSGGVKTTG